MNRKILIAKNRTLVHGLFHLLGLGIAGLLVAGLLLPGETNAEDAEGVAIGGLGKLQHFSPSSRKGKINQIQKIPILKQKKRSMKRIKLKKSCEINSKIDDTGNKKEFRNFF